MRAFVKTVKMDIERSQCWQPRHKARGINMLEQDTETVWEDRNRRVAELKARSAFQSPPNTRTETDFISQAILDTTMYYDNVDDEGRNRMDLKLYRAAMQADVDAFITVLEQTLVEKGLRFDQVFDQMSPIGNTYLHIAASVDNGEVVRLIAHHSPTLIKKRNFHGDTALHLAARAGRRCSMETLLKFSTVDEEDGPQVHQKHFLLRMTNEKGNTALHEALMNFHSHIAHYLIEENPEAAFYLNNKHESPLTLAAKAGDESSISLILSSREMLGKMIEQVKAGESPVHAAISSQKIGVIDLTLSQAPEFIHFTDGKWRFPLHFAASEGDVGVVGYILDKFAGSAIQRDKNGLFPIHWASIRGRVRVVDKLLRHCPHPRELLDPDGCNILHYAAKAGKRKVLGYILKNPTYEELINMKDKQGNTPLHLAATHFHPRFVVDLTWRDTKADVTAVNDRGMTALDAVEDNLRQRYVSQNRKKFTWIALGAGGVRNVDGLILQFPEDIFTPANLKDQISTLILVSTLVATVTFAAGLTMPGGYNSSDPYEGMAKLLEKRKFHVFIFCDTIAMYSSIIAVIILLLAQSPNMGQINFALQLAMPILGIAIAMMSLAFMAGVSVVVSKLEWFGNAILIMGVTFLAVLGPLFYLFTFPISSNRLVRYISYHPFSLAIYISGIDS